MAGITRDYLGDPVLVPGNLHYHNPQYDREFNEYVNDVLYRDQNNVRQSLRATVRTGIPFGTGTANQIAIFSGTSGVEIVNSAATATPGGQISSNGLINEGILYPTHDGTNGQVITTDGVGHLSFTSPGAFTVTSIANTGGGAQPLVDGGPTGAVTVKELTAYDGSIILSADNDQVFIRNGGVTSLTSVGTGSALVSSSTGAITIKSLTAGAGVVLTNNANDIQIAAPGGTSGGSVSSISPANNSVTMSPNPITTIGTVAVTGAVTTKGDLWTYDTAPDRLPVGTDGQYLSANSAQATGLQWVTPPANPGPLTTKGDVYTFDTAAQRLPVGTNGQVLTANSAQTTGLQWVTPTTGTITSLSQGTGITLTPNPIVSTGTIANAGVLTVANTGAGGLGTQGLVVGSPASGNATFKQITPGTNVSFTTNGNEVIINGTTGVLSATAGAGISVTPASTGNITITNTGVTSLTAAATTGSTWLINGPTGDITERRVQAGTGISLDAITDPNAIIINATGAGSVTSVSNTGFGDDVLVTGGPTGAITVKRLTHGNNISLSNDANQVTITGTIPLTTKGDIYVYDTAGDRLPVGTNGQYLSANSATSTGLQWVTPPTNPNPLTTKGDLYTFDTAAQRLPVGTDGQILSSNSSQSTGLLWISQPSSNNNPSYAVLALQTTQAISNQTLTQLTGMTTVSSRGVTVSSTSITLNATGLWLLTLRGAYAGSSLGMRAVAIRNGTAGSLIILGTGVSGTFSGVPGFSPSYQCNGVESLTSGTVLTAWTYQDSGASANIISDIGTHFSAYYLGNA